MSDQSVASAASPGGGGHTSNTRFWTLALGSVGVVFGDIGTSPLYAFREALRQAGTVTPEAVLGVVSLALWALIVVVTVKYVFFLMRADNKGEGGVLSLMALAQKAVGRRTRLIFILGVTGAALFYGDAVITPAISVLSAVEGLRTVPALEHVVTPTVVLVSSLVILAGLFAFQFAGTAKVSGLFGPICLVWFIAIAAFGALHIREAPGVLAALDPRHAVGFAATHGVAGLMVLGSVFLTVTGAEALYADMGHFGARPIRVSWLVLVLPCLAINYLGQGAFALSRISEAAASGHPVGDVDWFFQMIPGLFRAPMVVLACLATVIASQAVITGAFSLTQQAVQLGLLPPMRLKQTSAEHAGQIYIPRVNLILLVGVVFLVGVFKTSSGLAEAYGLAVTGTMAVTTSLAFFVVRYGWRWPLWRTLLVIVPLLAVDLIFLGANGLKILSGGAVPLAIGGTLWVVMATWVKGRDLLRARMKLDSPNLMDVVGALAQRQLFRVSGTAVYLAADPERVPTALLHNLKHNHVLHERNVILTLRTAEAPRLTEDRRLQIERLNDDFTRITAFYGFMESPDVPRVLATAKRQGLKFDIMSTSFFLGRRTLVQAVRSKLPRWQARLFAFLTRNAADPSTVFHIPPGRVVEMGAQVSI